MLSAVTSLQLIGSNLTRATTQTANTPDVKRDTDYYLANIGNIKTSKDFVNNYRLFSYAMKAYGLSDMTYAKGFMQKVLDGGVSNSQSFANSLSDSRFAAFAKAFNFNAYGAAATAFDSAGKDATTKYIRQSLEDNIGEQNVGAQIALYFQRQAPSIKSSLSILADKALRQFVQTAYNLPVSSGTTVEQDQKAIESKVNIADLQDPLKVQKMVTRFAAMWDLQNTDTVSTNAAVTVLSGSSANTGFSADLLASIQNRFKQF